MSESYTCEKHSIAGLTSYCPECLTAFESRRPALEMTAAERADALESIPHQLTIPLDSVHLWITELMGRDVWIHELAHLEILVAELRSGHRATFSEVIDTLPSERVIVAELPS